jgi:hypothetical protein
MLLGQICTSRLALRVHDRRDGEDREEDGTRAQQTISRLNILECLQFGDFHFDHPVEPYIHPTLREVKRIDFVGRSSSGRQHIKVARISAPTS